jgi:hypothetical protein
MRRVSPAAHGRLTRVEDNMGMRAFTVTENVRRMQPVDPDPFIAPPSGDRIAAPRPPSPRN